MGVRVTLAALLLTACGPDRSVTLLFPNEAALDATTRVAVETYASDVCTDLLETLAEESPLPATPSRMETFDFPFETLQFDVPTTARAIVARAFGSDADDPPFLAGCTNRFDPSGDDGARNVDVTLEHIPHPSLTLVAVAGHRQVGRPGETLPIPLTVRAQAIDARGRVFGSPGIEVLFRLVVTSGFTMEDGSPTAEKLSNTDGRVSVSITLPSALPPIGMRTATVIATSPSISNREVGITVGVAGDIALVERTIATTRVGQPRALAVGRVSSDRTDLIVAGSMGLSVIADPLGSASMIPIAADIGLEPAGVEAADLIPGGRDEIAIADAHRAGSEGAELRVLGFDGTNVRLIDRYVLTGSNAVGLAAVRTGGSISIAVATTGRVAHDVACSQPGSCQAMCPPGESCGPDGVCIPSDDLLVLLDPDERRPGKLVERDGCHRFTAACDVISRTSSFDCELPSANDRTDTDDCGCKVAAGTRVGSFSAPTEPRGIISAPLFSPSTDDLVVPTIAGLAFFEQRTNDFVARDPPTLQHSSSHAIAIPLNAADDPLTDVLWLEPNACASGPSIDDACPLARPPPSPHAGCLGIYQTDGATPVYMIEPPNIGECRRHGLPFVPSGICGGDLDGDGTSDIAILDPAGSLSVYSGDGTGGLLDPPSVSSAGSGPMLCADLDGDGVIEVVIADTSERLHILARP